jgi:hypothetical protein
MSPLRRVASALLALGLSLGAFSASPAPVRAEESGAELGAVVFGFDFSPSIYCTRDADIPGCIPIGAELATAVDLLAAHVNSTASRALYMERNINYRVVEFGKDAIIARVGDQPCVGSTGTTQGLDLLVSCLKKIAEDYRGEDSPEESLRGTQFVPILREVMPPLGGRCGLILFTDGEPEGDKAREDALKVFKTLKAENGHCAVLPIATGKISDQGLTFLDAITLDELADSPLCTASETEAFTWPDVYFENPEAAVKKIREAFAYVACAPLVPDALPCVTVAQYQEVLATKEFIGVSDFPDSYYLVGTIPAIGETTSREVPIKIIGQEQPPGNCAGPTPTPTEPPPVTEIVTPPCVADGPLSWLGCNPWWLLLLLGLIVARLLWIRREIEVSVNGKSAVGLGSGPWNGFDVYSGDARMNLNPRAESIQIHRSFVRSARYEDCRTAKTLGTKIPLRMDEEVTLQDGLKLVAGYGSGGRASSEGGRVSQGSSTGRKASNEATSSEPKEYKW